MKAIEQSRYIEYFVYFDILVHIVADLVSTIFDNVKEYKTIPEEIMFITFMIFAVFFCYNLLRVNSQLAKFFNLVKDKGYPKKTVTTVLVLFFIITMNMNIQLLMTGVVKAYFKFNCLSKSSYQVIEPFFSLCMSLAFYYLADFNH